MMKKLIIWYLAALSVLSVASAATLRMVWPEHYPSMLFLIPIYYALMLGIMVWIKRVIENKGKDRSIFFLAYRVVKILLALALLLTYFVAVGVETYAFAIVFMVFYLCLSAIETVLFMKGEKQS